MIKINKNSDFLMRLTFVDAEDNEIEIPIFDFEIEYFVRPENPIKVIHKDNSFIIGENTKLTIEGNTLIISGDNQEFEGGILRSKKTYYIPADEFKDSKKKVVENTKLDYLIGNENTDCSINTVMTDKSCVVDILLLLVSEEGDFITTEDNNLISLENG